jgi:hypothetical protein
MDQSKDDDTRRQDMVERLAQNDDERERLAQNDNDAEGESKSNEKDAPILVVAGGVIGNKTNMTNRKRRDVPSPPSPPEDRRKGPPRQESDRNAALARRQLPQQPPRRTTNNHKSETRHFNPTNNAHGDHDTLDRNMRQQKKRHRKEQSIQRAAQNVQREFAQQVSRQLVALEQTFKEAMRQVDHDEEDKKDDRVDRHPAHQIGIQNGYDGDDDDDSSSGYKCKKGRR